MPKLVDLSGNSAELTITESELQTIISRYKTERLDALPASLNEHARAVWISRQKIEDLLAKNPDSTGVRFYFGVVEDGQSPQGVHNLVLIGTVDDGEDKADLAGDDNWVLVTKNIQEPAGLDEGGTQIPVHTLICPPPVKHCPSAAFL